MNSIVSFLIAFGVLVVGFVLLIKGADAFVDGSSAIAKRLRVPSLVIGLTIVAMGTSLPELAVSVTASMAGNNEIAISNVTGSNIFNLMMVCGISALFVPLKVSRESLTHEFPFSVFCAILMAAFGATGATINEGIGSIGRIEGIVLLFFFALFLLYTVSTAIKARKIGGNEEEEEGEGLSMWNSIVMIVLGMVAIKFGGDFVVGGDAALMGQEFSYGAIALARMFGMSDTLIGLTIVAVGTSLPELVTSIVAAKKNEVDMAVGNVIGSNIFNILFILGVATVITPVDFVFDNLVDTIVLVVFSVLVWGFTWTKETLVRWEGVVMIICYIAFVGYAIFRVYAA